MDEPNANAGLGADRAARCRSRRSERSRSRCSNASRRDMDASHIARLRSSTCERKNLVTTTSCHLFFLGYQHRCGDLEKGFVINGNRSVNGFSAPRRESSVTAIELLVLGYAGLMF